MTDDARVFHEATKHFPDGARFRPHPRLVDFEHDPSNTPLIFKEYRTVEPVPLDVPSPSRGAPAVDALSATQPGDGAQFDARELARLLAYSAGITRTLVRHGVTVMHFRAASSAHSYPDVYVVCGDIAGLTAGVYYMHPLALRLDRLRAGDHRAALASALADPSVAQRPASVVIGGVPWRAAPQYHERALRHVYWDSGGILANMVAVADAHGIPARIALGFDDDAVAALMGLDGVHQFPVAVASFGDPDRTPAPPRALLENVPVASISAGAPLLFPLVRDAHHSGDLGDVADWRVAPATATGSVTRPPVASEEPIEAVVLRRGSTRRMLPDGIRRDAFEWMMSAAFRPAPGDWGTLLDHYLTLHAVEDARPGLYRWTADGLDLIEAGDCREYGRYVSLWQPQGGDGAFTTFSCADLDRVHGALGPRGYRAAQVEGGYVLERLHLAAFAIGVGATGLTFFDDAVSELFGTTSSVMTEVAVGRPAYRSRRGGFGADAPAITGAALEMYAERSRELQAMRGRPSGN